MTVIHKLTKNFMPKHLHQRQSSENWNTKIPDILVLEMLSIHEKLDTFVRFVAETSSI